jgi:hypothetical protein
MQHCSVHLLCFLVPEWKLLQCILMSSITDWTYVTSRNAIANVPRHLLTGWG